MVIQSIYRQADREGESKENRKQAGAELCQAQDQLGLPAEAKMIQTLLIFTRVGDLE